ncbi:MAG: hypothetical protein Q7J09_01220 [Methanocalculus sp.]|uniref:hypothetical protein n=1 Tax=Methanocalculus sp. TaxID=2004547 RepID=UPI00272860C9|nr:hypothetical protein [Methanocalculus sp.]MDO9538613.1 hypothetical protein [Methanocalculus sp.]
MIFSHIGAKNILDSKTIRRFLEEPDIPGYSRVKRVMDRNFSTRENINRLFQSLVKFLMSTKMSLVYIREELDVIDDTFRSFE